MPIKKIARDSVLTRIISEYVKMKGSNLHNSYIETALFLEDVLGIVLSDDEISTARLGDEEAILNTIAEKV